VGQDGIRDGILRADWQSALGGHVSASEPEA
jgi:hypothetical protein